MPNSFDTFHRIFTEILLITLEIGKNLFVETSKGIKFERKIDRHRSSISSPLGRGEQSTTLLAKWELIN